jgi:lipopolysaccharide/colanic/teichoic acid biosynthesis glycosyltransferase
MWKTVRSAGKTQSGSNARTSSPESSLSGILTQEAFTRALCLERKRTDRSGRPFVLILLEAGEFFSHGPNDEGSDQIVSALSRSTRQTDVQGWYTAGSILGVIFTEIGASDGRSVAQALLRKVTNSVCGTLGTERMNEIRLSAHVFPDDWKSDGPDNPSDSRLYPDLIRDMKARRGHRLAKRVIDVVGSMLALVVLSPLFTFIAIIIKLTSAGPVLFKQARLGQYGRSFTFLKFRSMNAANDPAVHQEYMKRLIAGRIPAASQNGSNRPYKLTADPRITRVGRLLRRTSLDELPQFLNVLRGEMSLVGPRPPIPYEFDNYELWHRGRLLAVKPGITGLWQVGGRNKLRFEEMVRLDLEYARTWTIWMDFKILLKTPRVLLIPDGAS